MSGIKYKNCKALSGCVDEKDLVFPHMYLVFFLGGEGGEWKNGEHFCLIEKKNKRIENGVCI